MLCISEYLFDLYYFPQVNQLISMSAYTYAFSQNEIEKKKACIAMLVLVQLTMRLFLVPSSDEYEMNIDESK